jgi:hypothetical protein
VVERDGRADIQGTLTPIVKVPSQAVPTERTLSAIGKLAADPKNIVYLISGRDGDFLEQHWGHVENVGFSAEHGSFVRAPGDAEFINMTETLDMSWMSEVEEIFRYYMEVSLLCADVDLVEGMRGSYRARMLTYSTAHDGQHHRGQKGVHHLALPEFRPRLWRVPVQAVVGPARVVFGAQEAH